LHALDQQKKADENCVFLDGERRCSVAGADYSQSANLSAWGANIGIGLGAVALISGTYLFITGKNTEREPSPSTQQAGHPQFSFALAPTAGGAQGAVFGRF
jgi:hypothetical protein